MFHFLDHSTPYMTQVTHSSSLGKPCYTWVCVNMLLVVDRFYMSAILRSRADSLRSHVILHQWIAFYSAFLNIHRSGVLTALTWLVPHETAAISAQVLCTPYNHAPCHFMQMLFPLPKQWAEEWVFVIPHNYNIYNKPCDYQTLFNTATGKHYTIELLTKDHTHKRCPLPPSLSPPPSPHQLVPGYAS